MKSVFGLLLAAILLVGCQSNDPGVTVKTNDDSPATSTAPGEPDDHADTALIDKAVEPEDKPTDTPPAKPVNADLAGTYKIRITQDAKDAMEANLEMMAQQARAGGSDKAAVDEAINEARRQLMEAMESARIEIRKDGTFMMSAMGQSMTGTVIATGNDVVLSPDPNSVKNPNASAMLKTSAPIPFSFDPAEKTLETQENGQKVIFERA